MKYFIKYTCYDHIYGTDNSGNDEYLVKYHGIYKDGSPSEDKSHCMETSHLGVSIPELLFASSSDVDLTVLICGKRKIL